MIQGLLGKKARSFGFPYSVEEADLVILPVPWDVTVSVRDGTRFAPDRILDVSTYLDFGHIRNYQFTPLSSGYGSKVC